MTEYVDPAGERLPRSAINARLDELAVGQTATLARTALPPAYRYLPSRLAREYGRARGKKLRALTVGRGVMFVRIA